MIRYSYIYQRYDGLIDMLIDDFYDAANDEFAFQFLVKNAANFDGAFATMETVSNQGYTSPNINVANENLGLLSAPGGSAQFNRYTRFAFNPTDDYGLNENHVLFFRIEPESQTGGPLGESPVFMVPPTSFYRTSTPSFVLSGTIPAGHTSFDTALELRLPRQVASINIEHLGGSDVFFTFENGAAGWQLQTGDSFTNNKINSGRLFLWGVGGQFQALLTFRDDSRI